MVHKIPVPEQEDSGKIKPQHPTETDTHQPTGILDSIPMTRVQHYRAAQNLSRMMGNQAFIRRVIQRQDDASAPSTLSDYANMNAPANDAPEEAPENAGPTSDPLLNEWLAIHTDEHLASDNGWIFGQYRRGGRIDDLAEPFQSNVRALLGFVANTEGAQFAITSYARSPEKQHVMHVSRYIYKGTTGYDSYNFDSWPDVVAAGGREALMALEGEARTAALQNISNPDVLPIVWDVGTSAASVAAAQTLAEGYGVAGNNPCANGGANFSWPTGNTSKSKHGDGKAIDADPAVLPDEVIITQAQTVNWPDLATLQAEFGEDNVESLLDDGSPDGGLEGYIGYKIKGLSAVAMRDAFYDLFFSVRSAARAGFKDDVHFQAP